MTFAHTIMNGKLLYLFKWKRFKISVWSKSSWKFKAFYMGNIYLQLGRVCFQLNRY